LRRAPFLGAVYGFAAERLNYQVRRVEIPLANLPDALDGMKIAQLSDIHLSGYISRDDVRRAVDMANDLGPDLSVVRAISLPARATRWRNVSKRFASF